MSRLADTDADTDMADTDIQFADTNILVIGIGQIYRPTDISV